jgi:hypothetical protein
MILSYPIYLKWSSSIMRLPINEAVFQGMGLSEYGVPLIPMDYDPYLIEMVPYRGYIPHFQPNLSYWSYILAWQNKTGAPVFLDMTKYSQTY